MTFARLARVSEMSTPEEPPHMMLPRSSSTGMNPRAAQTFFSDVARLMMPSPASMNPQQQHQHQHQQQQQQCQAGAHTRPLFSST